jgi:hypothetical protein
MEAESKKIGNVQLPPALLETMHMKGKLVGSVAVRQLSRTKADMIRIA